MEKRKKVKNRKSGGVRRNYGGNRKIKTSKAVLETEKMNCTYKTKPLGKDYQMKEKVLFIMIIETIKQLKYIQQELHVESYNI